MIDGRLAAHVVVIWTASSRDFARSYPDILETIYLSRASRRGLRAVGAPRS